MYRFCITGIILFITASLNAGEILLKCPFRGELSIQKKISLYRESSGTSSLDDILSQPELFKENSKGTSNFGYSRDTLWIHISLRRTGQQQSPLLLKLDYPNIDRIDFYCRTKSGTISHIETGDLLPFSTRPVESHNFIFPLVIPGEKADIYLRLKSHGSLIFPLSIISVHSFYREQRQDRFTYGLLFGILAIMIFYNFFIFLSVRERVYLFYVLHIAFFFLYLLQLKGFGTELFWPKAPFLNNIVDILATFGILASGGLFFMEYIETRRISRAIHNLILSFTVFSGAALFLSLFSLRDLLLHPSAILPIIMMPLLFIVTVIASLRRVRQAYFYLVAWAVLIAAGAALPLLHLGLIPDNCFSRYGLSTGIVFNVIILSLGLADRINRMKNEMQQLNVNLEKKVKSRTCQLEEALHELEVTNEQLTDRNSELTATQDVRRKDMAMAISVQNSILPDIPPVIKDWDIAFIYQPMTGISGDFYDFYTEGDRLMGTGIFDVSGHGIASGLITMIAKSVIFRNFIEGENLPLQEVIKKTNKELQREIGDADNFITGILLRFRDNIVEYANAAHSDFMIKSGGEVYMPETKYNQRVAGAFLGIVNFNYDFESINFPIKKGDYLLLFTDGLNEARNKNQETYSLERIAEAFKSAPEGSAQEVLNHMVIEYHDFLKDVIDQHDDMTIILLKKTG